jgi:hypothetical protein
VEVLELLRGSAAAVVHAPRVAGHPGRSGAAVGDQLAASGDRALEERIDLDGFRRGGQSAIDEDLDHIRQYDDLDAGYQQAHVTTMVGKRAYVLVGANPNRAEAEYPIITVESPLEVLAELYPATRRVVAAVRRGPTGKRTTRSATTSPSTSPTSP